MPTLVATFFLLGLMVISLPLEAQQLPNGWRLPSKQELADEERNNSPTRYAKAAGDFNGDGIEDEAFLLKSTNFNGEGLWVYLSQQDGRKSWKKLTVVKWDVFPNVDLAAGIETVPPGQYDFLCYDWEKDCEGPPHFPVKTKFPSISYFFSGKSSSLFYWSIKHKKFIRIWTSD